MANAAEKLKQMVCTDAKVKEDILKFMVETLHMESISDFAAYFTVGDYEKGVQCDILDKLPDHKDDRIQRGRLRVAWQAAHAETKKVIEAGAKQVEEEDVDAPLPSGVKERQEACFAKAYNGLKFEPEASPADNIFARFFREFRKRGLQVYPLNKMKSAAHPESIMEMSHKKRKMCAGLSIVDERDHDDKPLYLGDILAVLQAIKIQCVGWAMTGTDMIESKVTPGLQVREADLSECLAYLEWCTTHARENLGRSEKLSSG